jgi:hypothetical protein
LGRDAATNDDALQNVGLNGGGLMMIRHVRKNCVCVCVWGREQYKGVRRVYDVVRGSGFEGCSRGEKAVVGAAGICLGATAAQREAAEGGSRVLSDIKNPT